MSGETVRSAGVLRVDQVVGLGSPVSGSFLWRAIFAEHPNIPNHNQPTRHKGTTTVNADAMDIDRPQHAPGEGSVPASHPSVESAVAEAVCEEVLTSLCIEIACSTHRMAKTGVLPLSKIMDPSGGTQQRMDSDAAVEGGESTFEKSKCRSRSSSFVTSEDDFGSGGHHLAKRSRSNTIDGQSSVGNGGSVSTAMNDAATPMPADDQQEGTAAGTRSAAAGLDIWGAIPPKEPKSTGTRSAAAGLDIWGAIPPKEPKSTAKCDICGRYVSALRFAHHLDKCMNLGNSRASAGTRRS